MSEEEMERNGSRITTVTAAASWKTLSRLKVHFILGGRQTRPAVLCGPVRFLHSYDRASPDADIPGPAEFPNTVFIGVYTSCYFLADTLG